MTETGDTPQQLEQAFLREQFLRTLTSIAGKTASFNLHANTKTSAVYKACNEDFEFLYVTDLQAPMGGTIADVLLRSSDVIAFSVKLDK